MFCNFICNFPKNNHVENVLSLCALVLWFSFNMFLEFQWLLQFNTKLVNVILQEKQSTSTFIRRSLASELLYEVSISKSSVVSPLTLYTAKMLVVS